MSHGGKIWSAAAALALTLLAVAVAYWHYGERVFMNGSLSMRHKAIAADCSSCHAPWSGAEDSNCVSCHKATLRHKPGPSSHAIACAQCHKEHGGERASITHVEDGVCAGCHKSMKHKKKDPAAKGEFSRTGLLLTHATLIEAREFVSSKCLMCHKNLNFIKGLPVLTSMKSAMMSKHLERVAGVKCGDCHHPVVTVGLFDTAGGTMNYEKCKKCHDDRKVSDSCVNCHRYHHIAPTNNPAGEAAKKAG